MYFTNYQECDKLCEVHHKVQIFFWYTSTLNETTVVASQIALKKAFLWLLLSKYKCILPRKQLHNVYVWKTHFKICLNSGNLML